MIKVLDHGFVSLLNIAGPTRRADQDFDASDADPANAARMSFGQMNSGRTEEMDLRLARYLMKNGHTSPFEMVECWIEMKLPIFVARQFVRHRSAAIDEPSTNGRFDDPTINEISGRYVTLPEEWYIPKIEDVLFQADNRKQGGRPIDMNNPVEVSLADMYLNWLDDACRSSYSAYLGNIDAGIAMEQARLFLHSNHYTHWLWKQDLHNAMVFLAQRDHPHAQKEAQHYARAVDSLIRAQLPNLMALYDEYRKS